MTTPNLADLLKGIDWSKNIGASIGHKSTNAQIEAAIHRIAVWSKQLEIIEGGNPALTFVREMQLSIQSSGLLIGMCLYKPSAASSRTMVETCLYYTYFRTHPAELTTLVTDPKYYVSKSEIIEYHKLHTPNFRAAQSGFSLVGKLEIWYSSISAVVHGQLPGSWNVTTSISDVSFTEKTHELALEAMLQGEKMVHEILLCTVAKKLWSGFAPDAKTYLLRGMSGASKTLLGLDAK